VLGVREDVLSPTDVLVGDLLTQAGTAVEYGQELVVVAITAPVEAEGPQAASAAAVTAEPPDEPVAAAGEAPADDAGPDAAGPDAEAGA